MIESILYKTATYCRLPLDDESLGESGSIQTQKMMLEKYCRNNNFTIKENHWSYLELIWWMFGGM